MYNLRSILIPYLLMILLGIIVFVCGGCSAPPIKPTALNDRHSISIVLNPKPDTVFNSITDDSIDHNKLNNELKQLPEKFQLNLPVMFKYDFIEKLEKDITNNQVTLRTGPNIFRYVEQNDTTNADFTIRGKLDFSAVGREADINGKDYFRDILRFGLIMGWFISGGGEIALVKYEFLVYDTHGIIPDTLNVLGVSNVRQGEWEGGLFNRHYVQSTDNYLRAIKAANVYALRNLTFQLFEKLNEKYYWGYKTQPKWPSREDEERLRNTDAYK